MTKTNIDAWVRAEIRALSPYHVADAEGLIKLDAMENPYPFPQELVEGWLDTLRQAQLNRYPDPGAQRVKERLRATLGLRRSDELVLGNGSDEIIQMIAMAVSGADRVLLAPGPTFVMYRMITVFTGLHYVEVPLGRPHFELDRDAMLAAIERHRPAVVFLAYPNNPTGNLWSAAAIEEIIERSPGLVVVDEAYAPFASASFMDRLGEYPNLLLMRTLSKLGLAGLRLGYLVGPVDWLCEIEKVRLPYNINVLTQASVDFALHHQDAFDRQAERIRAERERLSSELHALDGIRAFPSEANFILFETPAGRAGQVFEGLRQRGVLIKNLSGQPGLENMLRVTVGTPEENRAFLSALAQAL